jgi:hypothetical protein
MLNETDQNSNDEDEFGFLSASDSDINIPSSSSGRLDEFTAIADWIANRSDLDDESRARIDHMMTNNTKKLKLATHVLAMRKVHRLAKFLNIAEQVEERLFNESALGVASTGDLIKMLQLIQAEVKSSIDYIQSIAKEDKPGAGSALSALSELADSEDALEKASSIKDLSPTNRDKIRKALSRLQDVINKK